MRRELPSRPNLEHLKSQAKDLLAAQQRGDAEALARIRVAVPSFARASDEEMARTFALHDAQSAIAREYGFSSWSELREAVLAAAPGVPQPSVSALDGQPLSPELQAVIRKALALRGVGAEKPTPERVPVFACRNTVPCPGTVSPLDVARPATTAAIEAALRDEPAFIAVFGQRAANTEHPDSADLHPTGCLCIVRHFQPAAGEGGAWTLLEGIRWITLEALERVAPYPIARVSDLGLERGDAKAIAALDQRLRETARLVAQTLPEIREAALAIIDATEDVAQLADIVVANFSLPAADVAEYARETRLARRLERAIALLEGELGHPREDPKLN